MTIPFVFGYALALAGCGDPASTSGADAPRDGGSSVADDATSEATGNPDAPGASEAPSPTLPMPEGDILSFPLDMPGPFNVGYRTWTVTYAPPGQPTPRSILVNVWYPTLDTDGPHPSYLGFFRDDGSLEGAKPAPPVDPKGYPVHAYSHGSSGFGGTSAFLSRHFASHGWLVVAPNHTGNTLGSPEGKRPLSLYYLRSTDVTASLDSLESLPKTDAASPLAGKARTAHVLLSGHSFGTLTTWASGGATFDVAAIEKRCAAGDFTEPCRAEEIAVFRNGVADRRVSAGLPMAGDEGAFFAKAGYDATKIPYLLMSGSDDVSGAATFERVSTIDFTWLDFKGGCHQLFALGGCGRIESKRGWALVSAYALAFARYHILGDASPRTGRIARGVESLSELVTFRHKGASSPPAAP